MTRAEMTKALDEEIARLRQVRQLLQNSHGISPKLERLVSTTRAASPASRRSNMSEEGRRRIAEAQRRRWAKQRTGVQ